jgi:hypothetical protein
MGLSVVQADDNTLALAMAVHDSTYCIDFSIHKIQADGGDSKGSDYIADFLIPEIQRYENEHLVKFVGAGIPPKLHTMSPTLCSRLWLALDIIPLVLRPDYDSNERSFWDVKNVDEQADSMARKCIM